MEWIHLPVERARKLKWDAGVAEHRGNADEGFQGEPIGEFFSEMIDALNYLDEIETRTHGWPEIRAAVTDLAQWAQGVYEVEQLKVPL